jgi:hypothetical protein
MTSIDSPQNKGLLWNVLLENGSFAGIPETKINEVNAMLNVVVEEVVGGGVSGLSIMESNKRVLAEMARRLGVYKASSPATTPTTTRENLQKERIDRMNDMAKQMSADMARYEPKKPKSVRFSDDVEKLSPELLESRLAQAIAARKLDVVDVPTTIATIQPPTVDAEPHDAEPHDAIYKEIQRLHGEVKAMYDEMKLMTK